MVAKSFALDVARFAQKAQGNADRVVRKVALDMLSSIVQKTPVGNPKNWSSPPPPDYVGGRARGSWAVGLGAVSLTATSTDKNGAATIVRAASALMSWGGDQVIYITSNLPYIRRLEYGWSQSQAPNGMVRVTVAEFNTFVSAALKSLPN